MEWEGQTERKEEREIGHTQCTPLPESPLYVYLPKSSPFVILSALVGMIWLSVYVEPESSLQVLQWLDNDC